MSEWQDLDSLYDEPEKVKPHYGEREREPEYKAETPGSTDEWLEMDDSLYESPEPEKEPMGTFEGAAQALKGGTKQVKESLEFGAHMTAGDYEGAAGTISEMEEYREEHPARPEAEELMTAFQGGEGIIGGVKGVLGEMGKDIEEADNAWEAVKETGKNVRAMGEGILKQTPNMVPPMTGLLAGGAAGSAILPGIGTAIGAWGGASTGNTFVEGQFIAIEALHEAGVDLKDEVAVASFLEENAEELFKQAATKGSVIGAVDVVTMGLAAKLLTGPAKAATQRTLLDMGVDVSNRAAVKEAVNTTDFATRMAADATYQATKQGIGNMARNTIAGMSEPVGEFAGEYLGQGLATGDWDEKEAFLEAMSSLGQSGFTFLGQKGYQTVTRPKEFDPIDNIVDALIDPNRAPEERQNAANEIYTRLNDESPVLGQAWARFAQDAIDNGSVIDYEKFSEAFNSGQLEGESLGPIQRAAERTPEKDRKQVQQIVAPVEDEEQAQREAAAETTEEKPAVTGEQAEVKKFEKESEAYRKEANTKEGQKKKEEAQKKAQRQQEIKKEKEELAKEFDEDNVEGVELPKTEQAKEDEEVERRAAERKDEPVGGRVAEKGSMVAGERYEGSPTEGQINADNYKRPKKNVHGMTLSFENPKGSVRSGTDQDGRAWKIRMKNDYGRILGTKGMDKEHIDFFAADNYDGKGDTVYIVDQHNKDGKFDEHKVIFGAKNEMDALKIYNANYEAGWTGGKAVTRMGMDAFKVWSTSNAPQNGPAARTRNIQQRKDTKYSTKPEIEGEGGAVDIATIKKEFKGSKVVDHGKGDGGNIYEITTPSGMTLFVHAGLSEIKIADTKKADRDWEGVNPQQAYEDDLAAGTFQMAGRNGLISLVSDAEERSTLRHETYHAVERMALTQREINILARKFGKEEGRAVAYQKWRNNRVTDTRTDKFFQKIFDFALRLMHSFMPTAASTFREIESGRPLRRAQKRKVEGGGVRYERKKKAAKYPTAEKGTWYGNEDYIARGGRIVAMSPDEYLSQVRPLDIDEVSRDNIDDLKNHIKSGRELDPLAIYEDGKEDGRHRAVAAKELGISEVPVIDFRPDISYERKKKAGPVKVPKVKLPKDRTSLRSSAKNIPFITEPVTLRKEPDPTLELQVGISGVPATRQDQILRLEKIAKKHPNPLKSRLAWRKFIADVTGSTGTSIIEPTRAIGWVKDHDKLKTYLKQMTKGQRKSSRDGMRLERQIGQKIKNGELTVDDFTMILTWVGLSRMLTAAIHEAGFLRAMNNDILEFARKVGKGEWTEADTEAGLAWVEKHFPKGGGMPSGAKSNLNATFKTTFPALSSAVSSDGKQLLHKIYSMFQEGKTAAEIRREFMFHAGDSGIQAKIFSFAMLWESVVVIDRWQVRNFWADNKALEDAGDVTVTTVNDKTGKKTTTTQPVIDAVYDKIPMGHKKENGADAVGGMVKYLDGPQGIAIYEGIERGLAEASAAVYGKPDVARLHWESWLIINDQEVGHASLKAIRDRDLEGKGVKEGRKIITENDIFAIEEGQEIYYIQDEQGTYTRLTKDEYLKIQGNKKETVRGRRGKAAARNAAERESRAIADGARPADAARERRAYQRKDAILGVRRELRALFERSRGKDQKGLPQPYRRGTDKYARRDVGGQKLSTNLLTPVKGIEKVFALGGISHPKLHQLNTTDKKFRAESALAFQNAITSAKANNDYGAAVYVYSQKEYEEMQLFLTEDGMAGFALKGTDMVSLFSNKKGDHSAVTNALLLQGIAEGGRKCDCFDTALPYMYGDLGMRVASREPWDERWKPEGWSKQKFAAFNNGEPDVLYMVYDPNYFDQYQPGDGRYLKDSVGAQDRWVEKLNKMIESGEQPMYSRMKARTDMATWTPGRVRHEISTYENHKGETRAYVGFVNPNEFVSATSDQNIRETIERHNEERGGLDVDDLRNETQSPFLNVNEEGEIMGHEGRHRMAALYDEEMVRVPVLIKHRGYADREYKKVTTLQGQDMGNGASGTSLRVRGLIPLTSENEALINDAMEYGDIRFSRQVVGLETSPIDESPTLQMLREKVNERMKVRPPVKTVLPPDQGKQILSTLVTPKGNISAAKVASKLQGYEKVVAKMRDDKLDIEAKIEALTEFITKKVPKDVKAHNHVHKAYARVVKGKTEAARLKALARTIDRIDQLNDQYLRRESLKAIKAYMKKQRPKLKGAVSRQPKGWDLYQEWQEISKVMAMPEEEVAKELEALEDMLDKGQLYTEEEQDRIDVLIDRKRKGEANEGDLMELRKLLANGSEAKLRRLHSYATLRGRSGLEVYDAFQKLQAELETLKLGWIDQMEQARAKLVERREKAISDITGGKDLMTPNQENKLKAEEQRLGKRIINQIRGYDDKHQSWEWMLDKLSRFSDAGILSSNLVKDFGRLVSRATLAEQVGLTDRFAEIQQKMAEIWGVDPNKPRLLNKARQADAIIEEAPVNRYDEEGKLIEKLAMSKNQAYKRWMEWQDLSLRDNLRKQGYTEKTIDEIWTWLTPELKAWAQWQLKEFYQDYHEGSASVFRQLFYTELAKTDNYSPIRREYDRGKEDNNLLKTNTPWSSVLNSATKQRIKNNRGIMLQDGDEVLARHITEMEHFKAWGIPMRELRTVLGGERVRKAIRQYHGSTALQVVNNFMDDFARGKVDQKFQSEWVSFFRRNFTTGAVGANPVVFVKQLTSIPAFAMDMPVKDWLGGLARMNTPGKARRAYRILKSSKKIQERYKVGFERDMIAAVMGGGTRSTTGTRNLADRMMILTKKGDWLAIFYGGWPVYEYHHKQAIKAGNTEAEASAIAMEAFEVAVDRTQQAGQLKDQNQYQRGSAFHQLFTMFYTAPSAYYRSWAGGVRGLQGMSAKEWSKLLTGRGDKKRYAAAKRVFFGQVVLPAMFMLASNGGEWDKDDMLKAVLLGPLSGLFLIRDFGIGLYNLTTGQNNYQDPGLPPVFSTVGEAGTAIRKGYKRSLDFTQQDLGEWMTDPDTWEFMQSALTTGGNISGVPLGPMTRTGEGVYDTIKGSTVAPKRRWVGFSEKKLDQTKRDYDKVARKMRLGGKGTKGHDAWKSYDKHVRTLNKIIRNDPGRSRQDNLDLMKRRADIMDRFLNLYNEL